MTDQDILVSGKNNIRLGSIAVLTDGIFQRSYRTVGEFALSRASPVRNDLIDSCLLRLRLLCPVSGVSISRHPDSIAKPAANNIIEVIFS